MQNETDTKPQYISLNDAALSLPVPTSYQTVLRWVNEGLVCGDHIVRLRAENVGARSFTTAEWLAEFQAAVDAGHSDGHPVGVGPDASRPQA